MTPAYFIRFIIADYICLNMFATYGWLSNTKYYNSYFGLWLLS